MRVASLRMAISRGLLVPRSFVQDRVEILDFGLRCGRLQMFDERLFAGDTSVPRVVFFVAPCQRPPGRSRTRQPNTSGR